jgi:hypothetical protein
MQTRLLDEMEQMRSEPWRVFEDIPPSKGPIFLRLLVGSEGSVSLLDSEASETLPYRNPGITPLWVLPVAIMPKSRSVSLQKWEGTVTGIKSDSFFARLKNFSYELPDEEAEFSIEELSATDRPLLQIGAVFYWSIGYYDSESGQRKKESLIRFRRLLWSRKEIEYARRRAAEIRDYLGWDEPSDASKP